VKKPKFFYFGSALARRSTAKGLGFSGAMEKSMGHEVQYKKMSNYVHRQWEVTFYLSV